MDIENVSKVNSNYGSAEAVKKTNTSTDASRAAAVAVDRSAEVAAKAVTATEESGFGDGRKNTHQVRLRLMMPSRMRTAKCSIHAVSIHITRRRTVYPLKCWMQIHRK